MRWVATIPLPEALLSSHLVLFSIPDEFNTQMLTRIAILSKIIQSTKEIVLNTHQLTIHGVEVSFEQSTKSQQKMNSTNVSYDAPRQRAIISFGEDLPLSEKARVVIRFEGTMNSDMAGFYRSKYKPTVPPAASVPSK